MLPDEPTFTPATLYERRLKELGNLQPGWLDGEGEPVAGAVIETVRTVIQALLDDETVCGYPLLFPTVDGGLQAAWIDGTTTFDVFVTPALTFEVCRYDTVHDVYTETSVTAAADVVEVFRRGR